MKIQKFESFGDSSVADIKDLKKGDIIMYHGSRCEVVEESETSVKVKSLEIPETEKRFFINQGQLLQYGVKLA